MENFDATLPLENLSGPDTQAVPEPKSIPIDPVFEQRILKMAPRVTSPEQDPGPNPLPIQWITPKIASCVRAISKRSGVNDGMGLGIFLTGISAIFMPSTTVKTFYGKKVGLNIFAQTHAPSSSRKSDMFNPLVNLLQEHDSERRRRIVEINRDKKIEKDIRNVRTTALKKQMAAASKNGEVDEYSRLENDLSQHLQDEPVFLPNLQILQSDVTPAAILLSLQENRGCSTILIDEGVLLYQKILNTEIHQVNSAWSGATLKKSTIRGGDLYVENPRLTSHTFLQNDIFAKLTNGKSFSFLKDTGYFSRVLICAPKTTQESNEFPEFKGSEDELNQLLLHLKSKLLVNYPLDGLFSGETRTLKLSPDARMLLMNYSSAIQEAIKPSGIYSEMQAFCGKAAEHVHKLAGLIHCVEQNETDEINYASVSAAIMIFDWYSTEHWRLIVKEGRPLNIEMAAEKLINWMRYRHDRSQVEWVSRADIPHHVECFRGAPDLLDDAIRYLQQSGDIDTKSGRRRGRKGGYRWHDIRLSYQFERGERYMPD